MSLQQCTEGATPGLQQRSTSDMRVTRSGFRPCTNNETITGQETPAARAASISLTLPFNPNSVQPTSWPSTHPSFNSTSVNLLREHLTFCYRERRHCSALDAASCRITTRFRITKITTNPPSSIGKALELSESLPLPAAILIHQPRADPRTRSRQRWRASLQLRYHTIRQAIAAQFPPRVPLMRNTHA